MARPVLTPLEGIGVIATAALQDGAVTLAKIAPAAYAQSATPGTLALRDGAGRTQVGTPATGNDAVNLAYVAEPWAALALTASWLGSCFYKKLGNVAFVQFQAVRQGALSSTLGTLPVGYRPGANLLFSAAYTTAGAPGSPGAAMATVGSDGTIVLTRGVSTAGDTFFGSMTYPI